MNSPEGGSFLLPKRARYENMGDLLKNRYLLPVQGTEKKR
jgi:hypothetical protein